MSRGHTLLDYASILCSFCSESISVIIAIALSGLRLFSHPIRLWKGNLFMPPFQKPLHRFLLYLNQCSPGSRGKKPSFFRRWVSKIIDNSRITANHHWAVPLFQYSNRYGLIEIIKSILCSNFLISWRNSVFFCKEWKLKHRRDRKTWQKEIVISWTMIVDKD